MLWGPLFDSVFVFEGSLAAFIFLSAAPQAPEVKSTKIFLKDLKCEIGNHFSFLIVAYFC